MTSCHEMKKSEVYVCEECGLELQVVKECRERGLATDQCGCNDSQMCGFNCCGSALKKKT